jgi:chaperonin GroEL
MEASLENAYILIHEKKISSMKDLLPLLEQSAKGGKPLLIIAKMSKAKRSRRWWSTSCAAHCRLQREGPGLRRSPQGHVAGHRDPDRRQGDHGRSGHQAGERQMSDLGQAKKITIDKGQHDVVEGKGKHGEIEGRVKEIRSQIDKTTSTTIVRSCRSDSRSSSAAWQ